jgi:phosphoribosyl-AMP cyclohydrolase
MKKIVISQPMFFPWIGMLEQIRLADVFVYYDDVQFSKGSFTNRVQIKTPQGIKWLTVPVNVRLGENINQVKLNGTDDWKKSHLSLLSQTYETADFISDMQELVGKVYARSFNNISELSVASMEALCEYFSIGMKTYFVKSSDLNIKGSSSGRVFDIVKHFGGDVYITGHGAKNYLDHDLFEKNDIRVEYIDYEKKSYQQLYGEFTPFVSALDLVANAGKQGKEVICSKSIYWKDFLEKYG